MTVDLIWLPQSVYSVPENKAILIGKNLELSFQQVFISHDSEFGKEICSSFNSRGSVCHNQLRNDFQDFFFNGGAPSPFPPSWTH
jgi:hypothetical protein